MARSQFHFIVAIPDESGTLAVVEGATVEVLFRDPDYTQTEDWDDQSPVVYISENGLPIEDGNVMTTDAGGRVEGWLNDGRYRLVITKPADETFVNFERNLDVRSGGTVSVSEGGVGPLAQIILEDSDSSDPSILLGSGEGLPDVRIQRTGDNLLVLDSNNELPLTTVINGNIYLSDESQTISANGSRVQNLGDPVNPSDAVTKQYVDYGGINNGEDYYATPSVTKYHNLNLYTPMESIEVTAENVYLARVTPNLGSLISAISFVKDDVGISALDADIQFGLFAEYYQEIVDLEDPEADPEIVRKMVCVARSETYDGAWNAETELSLRVGDYEFNEDSEEYEFEAIPFQLMVSNFTNNLYAGIWSSADLGVTGGVFDNPILNTDLGASVISRDQYPHFALSLPLDAEDWPFVTGDDAYTTEDIEEATQLDFSDLEANYRLNGIPFVRLSV